MQNIISFSKKCNIHKQKKQFNKNKTKKLQKKT